MFPVLPSQIDNRLNELISDLLRLSSNLGAGLNPKVLDSLGKFMLCVNSYYTNAMEGNPSKIKDIEDALNNDFSSDTAARNYQLEHLAHITVQKEMSKELNNKGLNICSEDFLRWIHKRFYSQLPEEMHFARTHSGEKISVLPGELRDRPADVGRHLPPISLDEVRSNLERFEKEYNPDRLASPQKYLALGASHHRLLWIHPFRDGNGRVARLFTNGYQQKLDISSHGLWTVTRAFGRMRSEYDKYLNIADQPRRNDYDGRGPLSEDGLVAFCKYFLEQCRDQINYIGGNLQLDTFEKRYKRYIDLSIGEGVIPKGSSAILEALFYKGEIERGEVQTICGIGRRRATEIIKELLQGRFVSTDSPHGGLKLNFTNDSAAILFPNLV
ncbi:MAG: Fic family protein [Deltaproteobacteria bacterium]|nr:Fic family protein [Deltaproteobacteria bacterium]